MDEITCAAHRSPGEHPCLVRNRHLTSCPDQDACPGCLPRAAVHGYLCRGHYERWERAWTAIGRLQVLAGELDPSDPPVPERVKIRVNALGDTITRRRWNLDSGGSARAMPATSSSSTTAGPRVPLSALQLDLDELERAWAGDPTTDTGATAALAWARTVFAAVRRHPTEPRRERLHRVRCASCEQVSVVVDPPAIVGGDQILRCVQCGWQTHDQDHAEAAAFTEALERDPYRPRRRVNVRQEPAGLEQLAGIAALARALA